MTSVLELSLFEIKAQNYIFSELMNDYSYCENDVETNMRLIAIFEKQIKLYNENVKIIRKNEQDVYKFFKNSQIEIKIYKENIKICRYIVEDLIKSIN